ncbi:MAG TPA: LuxR C-terminal-related transcriptional regulator [Gemmatimonadota bacterium]|nr:LuxR C-terminal-related transcriptional regulator [Gemmatimonadota bacterium]
MPESTAGVDAERVAARQTSWAEIYDTLRVRDPSDMTPREHEQLADAAWWLSKPSESIAARQRAYSGSVESGDAEHAATMAARLSIEHFGRGDPAVGAGWLMKARRHADDIPEGAGHGFLLVVEATIARYSGDLPRAQELVERATGIARRFPDPDLTAMAIHTQGIVLILLGEIDRGVALLDEAMASVVSGQLTPFFTGIVYCNVIGTCLEIADVRRADQWSEAARVWCESLPPESPFPGMCRINRAEVARLRGAWSEAEAEATRASVELMGFDPMGAAQAFYETGEIRRRIGNLAGAEECFARAREIGFDPQPGLALLRFSQGKTDAALSALTLAVGTSPRESRLQQARLLAALVDVALAVQDLDAATGAADRLAELAEGSGQSILQATAETAAGAVQTARGDGRAAVDSLRRAGGMWRDLRLPYEAARARVLLGQALRAAGDEDDAVFELRSAIAAFDRLGAVPDLDAASALLPGTDALPGGLSPREVQVLRLVAAGKSNREIAAELVISEHTVARHLQNMFVKMGVSSRSAATAFAFEHDIA